MSTEDYMVWKMISDGGLSEQDAMLFASLVVITFVGGLLFVAGSWLYEKYKGWK